VVSPVLDSLVEDVETVPVADEVADIEEDRYTRNHKAAKRGFRCQSRQNPSKLHPRGVAQPVFDVIIELDASDMHTFKVIPDAARAVDAILSGMPYHAHMI
jgi:hypothetical protein